MNSVAIPSGGYYQLSGQQSDLLSNGGSTAASNPTQSLLDALDSVTTSSDSSGSNNSYTLDLSPAAQELLNAGSSTSSTASSSSGSDTFTLTTAQQNTITAIIEKYKDAPQDQATFDEIQNDLNAAGLSPEQLAAQDQVTSLNPTSMLLDALNGNYTDPASQSISQSSTEQSKMSQYMQNIITFWQNSSSGSSVSSSSASKPSS